MTRHTAGPWKADPPRFGYQTVRQDPADWNGMGYQLICTVPQSTGGTHYGEMFKANARLIAAAPDLVEALKLARREYGAFTSLSGETLVQIDAALSKAGV